MSNDSTIKLVKTNQHNLSQVVIPGETVNHFMVIAPGPVIKAVKICSGLNMEITNKNLTAHYCGQSESKRRLHLS